MIQVTPTIAIAQEELSFNFIRAQGPGGQNVNKVETAVQLRFDAAACKALSPAIYRRLTRLAGHRMTVHGVIVITARRHRSQARNRKDAIDRLAALVREAAIPPKTRRATRPGRAARQQRLEAKQQRGTIKKTRARVRDTE